MRLIAAFLLTFAAALHAGAAGAQSRMDAREIGAWTLFCKVDGMTDEASCDMMTLPGRDTPDSPRMTSGPALYWHEETRTIVALADRGALPSAWIRIGRGEPASMGRCGTGRAAVCWPIEGEDKRVGAEIEAGAATALLRVGGRLSGTDFVYNLSGFPEAREKLREMRAALAKRR